MSNVNAIFLHPVGQGFVRSADKAAGHKPSPRLRKRECDGDRFPEATVKQVLSIARFLHDQSASDEQSVRILALLVPIFLDFARRAAAIADRRVEVGLLRALQEVSSMIEEIDPGFEPPRSGDVPARARAVERWLVRNGEGGVSLRETRSRPVRGAQAARRIGVKGRPTPEPDRTDPLRPGPSLKK